MAVSKKSDPNHIGKTSMAPQVLIFGDQAKHRDGQISRKQAREKPVNTHTPVIEDNIHQLGRAGNPVQTMLMGNGDAPDHGNQTPEQERNHGPTQAPNQKGTGIIPFPVVHQCGTAEHQKNGHCSIEGCFQKHGRKPVSVIGKGVHRIVHVQNHHRKARQHIQHVIINHIISFFLRDSHNKRSSVFGMSVIFQHADTAPPAGKIFCFLMPIHRLTALSFR